MIDAQNPEKSRHLPILDYYEVLQVEYLIAELRHKIYPRLKDKKYWKERVMEGKKVTIEKFAEKNHLPSIFTDEQMRRELEKRVYREHSHPIFTYKNEQNKLEQEYLDLQYYYSIGSDVRVLVFDETKIGKITKQFIPYKDLTISVTIAGVEDKYSISSVTRIL